MQLDLDKSSGVFIRSFSASGICINDQIVTAPVIVTTEKILCEWSPPEFEALSIADFHLALESDPEVILLGTGLHQRFPDGALIVDILRKGVGFEVMDTAAACRTFNVLASEYRKVVAALL